MAIDISLGRRFHLRGGRRVASDGRGKARDHHSIDTSSIRLEIMCLVFQIISCVLSLIQGVSLALVTSAWHHKGPGLSLVC